MPFEVPMTLINKNKEKPIKPEEELEKVDVTAFKLKEKYGEYKDMEVFIDYLASMERIFIMAKMEKWGAIEVKKAFIDAESYLMSLDSALDEDIFNRIKDDFQSAYRVVDMIRAIATKLISEHSQSKGCVDFIEYMRDSLILLSDISDVNIDENKDRILRSRMLLICNYDGEPDMGELEKVYGEFKNMLKDIKNKTL